MEEGTKNLKGVIWGYSLRTIRFVNGDDITQVLERDCGDSVEIIHLKGIIVNEPGLVAAVGGIPDKLKLGGGISFWFPCPTFKVPNNLPLDLTARHKALFEAYEKSLEKKAFQQGFARAYQKAMGLSLEEDKDKDEAQNMYQQAVTMVEINIAVPLDPLGLYLNPQSIPTHPIPIKQAAVESQVIKYGYYILTLETTYYGTTQILGRHCGDSCEMKYLKGIIFKDHEYVAAAGGIPRNLRLNVGISFWYPCPNFKGPRVLPQDPIEKYKVAYDVIKKGVEANDKAYMKAYNKALLQDEQSEEEEPEMDPQPCTMIELNIAHPRGTGGTGSSELMFHVKRVLHYY